MIGYVDSSTVVERALAIARGEDVDHAVGPAAKRWLSSEITMVEVHRVLMRTGIDSNAGSLVMSALMTTEILTLASPTMHLAARLPIQFLKSLDAIHIASALIARCDMVFTRDRQMQRACHELGLAVA